MSAKSRQSADTVRLSIVVVVFKMAREAPRTLFTLSSLYQQGVGDDEYEVVVVDNGSTPSLDQGVVEGFGKHFHYVHNSSDNKTLANAVNTGVKASQGELLGVVVDGARMASPGVLKLALECFDRFENPLVGTPGFHLGHDIQSRTVLAGYNQVAEDRLLASVNWEDDGYKLFEISTPGASSHLAWFGQLLESNLFFLKRSYYEELSGYDERFDFPGGGLVNLDFWLRGCSGSCDTVVTLMGEATFHQFHGGVLSNRPDYLTDYEIRKYMDQYKKIRGESYHAPTRAALLHGYSRPQAANVMRNATTLLQAEYEQQIPG